MTFGKKLTLSFAAMGALLLTLSWAALSSLGTMKERFDEAAGKTTRKIVLADAVNTAESDMLAWQRAIVLYTYAKDPATVETAKQRFRDSVAAVGKAIEDMRPLMATEEGRRLLETAKKGSLEWVAAEVEVERLCAAGDPDGAVKLAGAKIVPIYDELARQSIRLAEMQNESLEAGRQEADAVNARSRWIAMALIVLSLAVGVFVGLLVRRISSVLRRVASEMQEGADQVASAASQVSASSQGLAQGASEQAATLEETSSSSEEISSMTRKNAENSQLAAKVMGEAARLVDEANRKLEQMVGSMKEINTSSDKISKIIKVIDEIAFQTNILALNAAVEAARAGEAGMGFAVVADEVRNLAQRCAQAAKDTAGLIEESITKSTEGSTRLDEVASSIQLITESSLKVKTLVDEVSLGSQEQARGIEQVAKAIAQMEQVTQKTAANAEESASAGEELSAQSDNLLGIVKRLTAMVGGGEADAGTARRKRSTAPAAHKVPAAAPPQQRRGLAALGAAVSHDAGADTRETAMAAKAGRDAFPLDDEFKTF